MEFVCERPVTINKLQHKLFEVILNVTRKQMVVYACTQVCVCVCGYVHSVLPK